MGDRLALHDELLRFVPNVYFQPPSNVRMVYPCIVYSKTDKVIKFGNNKRYFSKQVYQIMLVERVPDSGVADDIEGSFQNCSIEQYYTMDNLNHTIIELYY